MIDFALLGIGGGMPMPNRFLSAGIINYKGRKILIDCGEGTQVSMRMHKTGFKSIDVICITHIHGDHINGLPGLLGTIGNSGRIEPIIIVGPIGIKNAIDAIRVLIPYLPYEIIIIENKKEILLSINKESTNIILENEDIILKLLDLEHSAPCVGYAFYIKRGKKFDVNKAMNLNIPKVIWNKLQKENSVIYNEIEYKSDMVLGDNREGIKLSYITDSRPIDDIVDFIKDSDLFICEGTYGDSADIEKAIKNKHMTFEEAATLSKKGNANRLILTHFSPSILDIEDYIINAKKIFNNVEIGEEGKCITLNFKE